MKLRHRMGWIIAALSLSLFVMTTAYAQLIPQQPPQPTIDARLAIQSDGTFYVLHDGTKFQLPLSDMSDAQLSTIPDATQTQWADHFAASTEPVTPAPPAAPYSMPSGYS